MKRAPRRKWTRSRAYRRFSQRQERLGRAVAPPTSAALKVRYYSLGQRLALALARHGWAGLAKRVPLASVRLQGGKRRIWSARDIPYMAALFDVVAGGA